MIFPLTWRELDFFVGKLPFLSEPWRLLASQSWNFHQIPGRPLHIIAQVSSLRKRKTRLVCLKLLSYALVVWIASFTQCPRNVYDTVARIQVGPYLPLQARSAFKYQREQYSWQFYMSHLTLSSPSRLPGNFEKIDNLRAQGRRPKLIPYGKK